MTVGRRGFRRRLRHREDFPLRGDEFAGQNIDTQHRPFEFGVARRVLAVAVMGQKGRHVGGRLAGRQQARELDPEQPELNIESATGEPGHVQDRIREQVFQNVRTHGRAVGFVVFGDREAEGVAVIFVDRQSQSDARAGIRLRGIRIIIRSDSPRPEKSGARLRRLWAPPARRSSRSRGDGAAIRHRKNPRSAVPSDNSRFSIGLIDIVGPRAAARRGDARCVQHGQEVAFVCRRRRPALSTAAGSAPPPSAARVARADPRATSRASAGPRRARSRKLNCEDLKLAFTNGLETRIHRPRTAKNHSLTRWGVVKVTRTCRCISRYALAQSTIYAARVRHSANAAVRLCL